MSIRRVIGLFCLALFLSYSISPPCIAAAAPEYRNTAEAARESIWKAITSGGASSATVAVMDGGKIVYSEVFGAADRKAGRSVDRETRFNIGSTSKMFVAVALLMLVDEGRITLDDPVALHIPEFRMKDARYKDITVRMLMNHSSALPGSSFLFGYEPYGDPHGMLLDRLKDSNLKDVPGRMGIYCNDGFTLAEILVERVSGQKFINFLKERVFLPLGLKDTGASVGETGGNLANYYDPKTGKEYPPEVILVQAAGGLSSTADDLCRFADSFCPGGKKILSKRSIREILGTQPTSFSPQYWGTPLFESFGWDYSKLPAYESAGISLYAKGGGTGVYSTGFEIIPEKRLAVAVSLSGRLNGDAVARAVLNGLLRDKGLPVPPEHKKGKPVPPETLPPDFDPIEGIYTDGGIFVKIKFNRDRTGIDVINIVPDSEKIPGKTEGDTLMSFVFNGGLFVSFEKDISGYFLKAGDSSYFVATKDPFYGVDVLKFQSVPTISGPKKLSVDMNGKLWFIRNLPPLTQFLDEPPMVRSQTFKELPGYLTFMSPLKVEDEFSASYAAPLFRDQSELFVFEDGGTVWARMNIFLLSEAKEAKVLRGGKTLAVIGGKGLNEWYRSEGDALMHFDIPSGGRIMVIDTDSDVPIIYDSVTDDGEVYAAEGAFIACFGRPGDIFMIDTE